MAFVKVLIKFTSPTAAGNVVSGMALRPELLILVGYGSFLTDTMRNRYNHFFHHRMLETVLADPVGLEPMMEPDIEVRLQELLTKYAPYQPVLDISDADAQETLALGTVLRGHKGWQLPILDTRIRESLFLPLKNADLIRRIPFPALTASEMSFLRNGTSFDATAPELAGEDCIVRSDLDRTAIRQIRTMMRLYSEQPSHWRDVAMRLAESPVGQSRGRVDFVLDARELGIRDEILEELECEGIVERFERRGGVIHLRFPSVLTLRLFLHIERMPVLSLFLIAAFVRGFGRTAAYHDLTLRHYTYVTGIHRCLPVIIGLLDEKAGPERLYRFACDADRFFERPVRMILVRGSGVALADGIRDAAELLGIEITDAKHLSAILKPN